MRSFRSGVGRVSHRALATCLVCEGDRMRVTDSMSRVVAALCSNVSVEVVLQQLSVSTVLSVLEIDAICRRSSAIVTMDSAADCAMLGPT